MAQTLTLRWLDNALKSITDEATYLAEIHPKLAKALIKQVTEQLQQLINEPHLGRAGRIPGTRELIIEGYLYIATYRVKNSIVEILEIFHTA